MIESGLKVQCLEVLPEIPDGAVVTGTLLLWSHHDPPILWNMETEDKVFITEEDNETLGFADVSPDGKWMNYYKITRDQPSPQGKITSWLLYIVTSDGEVYKTIPWEDEWVCSDWFDNEHLIIDLDGEPLRPVLILNPFTGEQEEYPPDYPDIDTIVPYDWELHPFSLTVYDPSRMRVVYPSWYEEFLKVSYVIWDLQSDQMVAELPFPAIHSYPPRWAPDGEYFIVANLPLEYLHVEFGPDVPLPNDEFYLISRDGEVLQLTNFVDTLKQKVSIYHYRWSPDGRYVAFWLDMNLLTDLYTADGELAVLDINTQEVTLYCIRGEFKTGGGELPVWSPNSQQILVKSVTEEGEALVVFVDIVEGWAAEIIEGYTPAGWMVSPQE
jgi:hypothetical protein